MIHTYELLVLEEHLDSLGHVNNVTYLRLFEQARWDMLTKFGFTYDRIQATKLGPVILEINLKFLAEIRLREKITIRSHILSYDGWVGTMEQQILKVDGKVGVSGAFKFGLFDIVKRSLVFATPEWDAFMKGLQGS